jgi:Trk-type K+ transport system membrane component
MVAGGRVQQHGMRRAIGHPERIVPLAFLAGIAIGTILLMLPLARAGSFAYSGGAPFIVALFSATSALCVTGLAVVYTASYWSPFGHIVLLLLVEVGGIGILTGATLLGLLVSRRIKLRRRLMASAEMRSLDLGDVRHVLVLVLKTALLVQTAVALVLTLRFCLGLGFAPGPALWHGLFHSVMAFMNAGFTTLPTGLMPYAADWLLLSPLMLGVIIGGIGFPVIYELRNEWRVPEGWSIHTKLTLFGSAALLLIGALAVLAGEWSNPATLGPAGWSERVLGSLFHSVMTRSGGFNVHDTSAMEAHTLLVSSGLMLIGGGSASTAGGIRITTFLLLGFVVWSEIRGHSDTVAFRRRLAPDIQRQAVAIVLTAVGFIAVMLLALVVIVDAPVDRLLFEAISAFATVGLSVGLSAEMPPAGQAILVLLMYVGRVGTVSLVTALALKVRHTPYRYPEERPIVG